MANISPADCASQSMSLQGYIENGRSKVKIAPDHDVHRCQICRLCLRHCTQHFYVLEGLKKQLPELSYAELKRVDEEWRHLAEEHSAEPDAGVTIRKAA